MPTNNKTFVNVVLRYEDGTAVEGISDLEDVKTFLDEHKEEFARVRHGRWVNVKISISGDSSAECSLCGAVVHNNFSSAINYCPNCGAKMGLKEEQNEKTS